MDKPSVELPIHYCTVVGTTYGVGDGSTTFNLPDLRGRAVAGLDNMGGTAANRLTSGGSGINGIVLGASGGSETVTLTGAQTGLPGHSHTITDPGHSHNMFWNGYAPSGGGGGVATGTYSGGLTPLQSNSTRITGTNAVSEANASSVHNNTQPTIITNYIIKY